MGPAQVCAGEVVADMVQMSLEAHEVAIQRPSQAAGKATSAVQGVVAVNCAAGGAVGSSAQASARSRVLASA